MRVLVTGGTGLVGSHTAKALMKAGHDVRLLARDESKLPAIYDPGGYAVSDVVVGDMLDEAIVGEALRGCEAVVHTAAIVDLESRRSEAVQASNVRGVELVVGGASERGVESIVYVSSASALYVPGAQVLRADGPLGRLKGAYAQSKIESERYVRGLQERRAPIHTTYPTGVIGPDDPGLSDSNRSVQLFVGTTMLLTSGGFQPVDVRDLAEIHVALVEARASEAPPAERRHMAAGEFLQWAELGELLEQLAGRSYRKIPAPGGLLRVLGRAGDIAKRFVDFDFPMTLEAMTYATQWILCDSSRTRSQLGVTFRPHVETLRDTMLWLARNGHVEPEQIGRLASELEEEASEARPEGG